MFLERLKQLQQDSKLNVTELGKIVDIPPSTIYSWQNGSIPTIDKVVKLADFFKCSVDYLVGREDDLGLISLNTNLTAFQNQLLSAVGKLSSNEQFKVLGFAEALGKM